MWPRPISWHGITFKSYLEVQWAKAFDAIGFDWEYEPVKFSKHYTPDFVLLSRTIFVEVKSKNATSLNKIWLCRHPVLVVFGSPVDYEEILVFQNDHNGYHGQKMFGCWIEAYTFALTWLYR